jgi:hypothetical protein
MGSRRTNRAGSFSLRSQFEHSLHSRNADVSAAQIKDLNLPIRDLPGAIACYSGSDRLYEILTIIGHNNRRDALHVDSAFKSGCKIFVTTDSHILQHKERLHALLAICFLNPRSEELFGDLITSQFQKQI